MFIGVLNVSEKAGLCMTVFVFRACLLQALRVAVSLPGWYYSSMLYNYRTKHLILVLQ